MNPTKTESIHNFLLAKTHPDLATLYNHDMEVQVNVVRGDGERISGDYKGSKWHGWTNGTLTWKAFRIPYGANSDPNYTDLPMQFPLDEYAEGIGMTGWDWGSRCSKWVAFDFDAIIGHSDVHQSKLSNVELTRVQDAASMIPWVTIRKSTSGHGLHLYVFLPDVHTENHNEHAGLARAVLSEMSLQVGFDFDSKVDICGGNMWVWHRKMAGTDGLSILKQGSIFTDLPKNWKDHVRVVKGRKRRQGNQNTETTPLDTLSTEFPQTQLDDEHKKLIEYLRKSNAVWWWDQDKYMLVTHTMNLKKAHADLGMKGLYDTNSGGLDMDEQNCFLFPLIGGGWSVRRFSQGCTEHPLWDQDAGNWTRCYLNRLPDLSTACQQFGGAEDKEGEFLFYNIRDVKNVGTLLGVDVEIDSVLDNREIRLKESKEGKMIIEVQRIPDVDNVSLDKSKLRGWAQKKNLYRKFVGKIEKSPIAADSNQQDNTVRHLVTEHDSADYGWVVQRGEIWGKEPWMHIHAYLISRDLGPKEINMFKGVAVQKPWILVNRPFEGEYPGNRLWNRDGAQLAFTPSETPKVGKAWMSVLKHLGTGLDDAIKQNDWCREFEIESGADYLMCWIASLFQKPMEPLPYIFFYSAEQSTGKSTFHEALAILLTRGYMRADAAMTSQGGFNKELEGALVCVIEETDLKRNKQAYNRMKDWVTSKEILIHPKGETPYHTFNTTHWIQCANDHRACPIFDNDTRVTMISVPPLESMLPRTELFKQLEKEAPDFLGHILSIELPRSNERLNIPVIETSEKGTVQQSNMDDLELFIFDNCQHSYGDTIGFTVFFEKFRTYIDPLYVNDWSTKKVGTALSLRYTKGRSRKTNYVHIGDMTWKDRPACKDVRKKLQLDVNGVFIQSIGD